MRLPHVLKENPTLAVTLHVAQINFFAGSFLCYCYYGHSSCSTYYYNYCLVIEVVVLACSYALYFFALVSMTILFGIDFVQDTVATK